MTITITARELFDRGLWMTYCDISGTSEWAVKEGRMNMDEEVTLSAEQARHLGLIEDELK